MLISAGMGIGIMFWSVAEPTAYFTNWWGTPLNVAERTPQGAQIAMGATMFHWGLHPWAIYAVVALALVSITPLSPTATSAPTRTIAPTMVAAIRIALPLFTAVSSRPSEPRPEGPDDTGCGRRVCGCRPVLPGGP